MQILFVDNNNFSLISYEVIFPILLYTGVFLWILRSFPVHFFDRMSQGSRKGNLYS